MFPFVVKIEVRSIDRRFTGKQAAAGALKACRGGAYEVSAASVKFFFAVGNHFLAS
jgi:hypothetical protein